jgi:hypothetical protein
MATLPATHDNAQMVRKQQSAPGAARRRYLGWNTLFDTLVRNGSSINVENTIGSLTDTKKTGGL